MISAFLMGGIGNQMFQIAAASSLAIENNDEAIFNFESCFTPLQGNSSLKYSKNIFKNVKNSQNLIIEHEYKEKSHEYSKIPYFKNLLINGYFQNEKYFIENKHKIIDLFYINNEDINFLKLNYNYLNFNETVSIHIRRGDYLKFSDIHPVCEIEYYNKAMENFPDKNFIFISDDMEWVKNNFKGSRIFYSKNNNEILDFTLQSICCSNIIANSSFSWWAAYLNKNQSKKIIAPLKWFGKNGPSEQNDITPSNWIRI
jgi:hypothetical protein